VARCGDLAPEVRQCSPASLQGPIRSPQLLPKVVADGREFWRQIEREAAPAKKLEGAAGSSQVKLVVDHCQFSKEPQVGDRFLDARTRVLREHKELVAQGGPGEACEVADRLDAAERFKDQAIALDVCHVGQHVDEGAAQAGEAHRMNPPAPLPTQVRRIHGGWR
jgi:hypothetical protein